MKDNFKKINLNKAQKLKRDEFYTQLADIERELQHYESQFKDKVVYCNCDSPDSNFVKYFQDNYDRLGLKGFHYSGMFMGIKGDFRSSGSIELLKQCDIVVTNPPFSLFREYIDLMMEHKKKILIVGNINGVSYKNVFRNIMTGNLWLGVNHSKGFSGFIIPKSEQKYSEIKTTVDKNGNRLAILNNCCWFTNLSNEFIENREITFKNDFVESNFERYDNYPDGIHIERIADIPDNYYGDMGVPITFLLKWNPKQFQIVRWRLGIDEKDLQIKGRLAYFRFIVRRKK